jgi:hypothetical protein
VSSPAFTFADRRSPRSTWAWLRAIATVLVAGLLCLGATAAVIMIAARITAAAPEAPPPPTARVTTTTAPAPVVANGGIASALNPGDRAAMPTTTLGVLTPPISPAIGSAAIGRHP